MVRTPRTRFPLLARVLLPALVLMVLAPACRRVVHIPSPPVRVSGGPAPFPSSAPSIYSPAPRDGGAAMAAGSPSPDVSAGDDAFGPEVLRPGSGGLVACGRKERSLAGAVQITTTTTCYRVSGSTIEEINEQIEKKGPEVKGQDAVAATRWSLRWGYTAVGDGGSCRASRIQVSESLTYEYPNLVSSDAGATTVADWERFMTGEVIPHEERHGEIATLGADELLRTLRRVPDAADCDALRADLDAAAKRVVRQTRSAQDAFDRREEHT